MVPHPRRAGFTEDAQDGLCVVLELFMSVSAQRKLELAVGMPMHDAKARCLTAGQAMRLGCRNQPQEAPLENGEQPDFRVVAPGLPFEPSVFAEIAGLEVEQLGDAHGPGEAARVVQINADRLTRSDV